MIELRKHVERIVRPIRASHLRKDRMREELLAHLTTIYEVELAQRPHDAAGALTNAVTRFGDPDALRTELQASVSWLERVFCSPIPPTNGRFPRRPGETVPRFLRRVGPWSTLVNAIVWALLALFIVFVRRENPARNAGVSVVTFVYFCAANAMFLPLLYILPELLCDSLSRQWDQLRDPEAITRRRARASVATKLLAAVLIRGGLMLPFALMLRQIGVYPFTSTLWMCVLMTAWTAVNVLAILSAIAAMRRWNRWEGLQLDAVIVTGSVVREVAE